METAEQTPLAFVPVAEFYAGKSVFVTGVTGFLGKVFLEKLLYSCKDIGNVYVLMRDKKDKNAKQRIEEVINKPLFSRLKEERPNDLNKVIPIAGDINLPNLGISTKDEEILLQKVSVVFHIAATIRFNEELKDAVNTNVGGTKCVLHLCQRMKNIRAFVHVSTAYCNTDKQILEEKVYSPPVALSEVLKFLEQSNHDREETKALLKGAPNTYTFTKALAETYVAENYGNIPTVIIRPATRRSTRCQENLLDLSEAFDCVNHETLLLKLEHYGRVKSMSQDKNAWNQSVTASFKEPLAGWVENWSGATGILAAIMKGAIRVLFADGNNVLDLIPVDYVANLIIVAAARCRSSDNVAVYNSCTSSCNPIILSNVFNNLKRAIFKNGFGGSRMTIIFTKNKYLLSTLTFLLQTLPAYLADLFLRATGKQPIYMKIQSKVVAGRDILEFFTSNSWEMKAYHTRALHASLSAEDRHQFPCDPSDINWDVYFTVYAEGIKRLLMEKRV